jgi:transposase InsO family protein
VIICAREEVQQLQAQRDYVPGADLSDAETVIRQLTAWIDDYNRLAPHSFLGMLSPMEFRALNPQTSAV